MKKWSNRRGLVVDDEPEILDIIKTMFELQGCLMECATNGQEAFEMTQKRHYDFVISDVRMPGGDGVELLKKLRALRAKRKPVALMISSYSDLTSQEALSLGAIGLLPKPFNRLEIESLLEEHLSR